MRGEGVEDLTDRDFFGIMSVIFELFSEGGTTVDDKWADIGGIVGNILGDSGDFFDV